MFIAATSRDPDGRQGGAFLFLEPVIGVPHGFGMADRGTRQMNQCRRWLDEIIQRGILSPGAPDPLSPVAAGLPSAPHAFAFALSANPGLIRVFLTRPEDGLTADAQHMIEAWAYALGGVWPNWRPWLARMPGNPGVLFGPESGVVSMPGAGPQRES